MKNSTLVIVLLAGLNVALLLDEYCVADWIGKDCGSVAPGFACACEDNKRYQNEKQGGGTQVAVDEAKNYLNNFQHLYNTHAKGAFISKRAIDDLFCRNPEANGVFCYFGLKDESAESFVLLVEDGKQNQTLIKKTDPNGHAVYTSDVMCPDICGLVGE